MKHVLKLSLFTLLLLIISSSCKKKVDTVNQDYIGSWSGSDSDALYSIYIQSNSKAEYKKFKGATTTTATGNAKLSGERFKIGFKKFDVTQHPLADSTGFYSMILDGVTYYRY